MDDIEIDYELREVAARVRMLSRDAPSRPDHKAQLRVALLNSHRTLSVQRGEAGNLRLVARLRPLKKLAFVGLPAAVVAIVASTALWLVPISGGQPSPAAEAQRITSALARTAPTVTAWEWTLHRISGHEQRVDRLGVRLTPFQRLYVDHGRTYLYSYGQWKLLAPVRPISIGNSADLYWQRALSGLLANLQTKNFVLLHSAVVDGGVALGIRTTLRSGGGTRIAVTAWVDESSGLIVRLERQVSNAGRVIERDVADYVYQRSG